MEIVETTPQLEHYIETAVRVSGDAPVLIDRYLRDAVEVDVDALGGRRGRCSWPA
jgi:carbamoyl-phosphate synthase large subunit